MYQFPRSDTALAPAPRAGRIARALDRLSGALPFRHWGLLLPALLPALLFVPVVLAPPLNHDVAAVLNFSERWLGGERLNVDLIDVNPPLVYVLNLVPAILERITPLDGVASLQLCLIAWGLLAWRLSFRVRDRAGEGPAERAFLDVLPALFLFAGGYDFGQREHVMAVAALPYLLAAARREGGRAPPRGVPAALFAGLGFALKPHFLAIPALVELLVFAGRFRDARARRGARSTFGAALAATFVATSSDPAIWAMASVWAVYLASLPILFPEYLGNVVPMVWSFYLDIGGLSALQVLLTSRMACICLLLAPIAYIAFRQPFRAAAALPRVLVAAALGAVASAAAQHKGWSYHIVPVEHFTLAAALVLAARWLDAAGAVSTRKRTSHVAAACCGAFSLYVVSNGEAPWKELNYGQSEAAGLTELLNRYAPGERVLVLSPGIYPIFPALNYAHAKLTLRTMNMWLIEGAYQTCLPNGRRYRDPSEMGRAEFFVYRTVAEDFARAPPAAVVVDKQPGIPWCGSEFDYLAYFSRHQLFAEVFSHYRLAADWDRYRIYTRAD